MSRDLAHFEHLVRWPAALFGALEELLLILTPNEDAHMHSRLLVAGSYGQCMALEGLEGFF